MRVLFNEELQNVADDMERMVQAVRDAMKQSCQALLRADLALAQQVIEADSTIDEIEARIIEHCVQLLARQNPVATDLRIVVSTMRLATTFERMGDLATHIAQSARRSYPDCAVPAQVRSIFEQMAQHIDCTSDRIVQMMSQRDTALAQQIISDDNALDELHLQTFSAVLDESFQGSKQQLIDVVLLSRFLERLGDHAVSAARRVVYIVSGCVPDKDGVMQI